MCAQRAYQGWCEIDHARQAALALAAEQIAAGQPPAKVARVEFSLHTHEQMASIKMLEASGFPVQVVPYADLAIAVRVRELAALGEDAIVLSGDRDFAIFGCKLILKDLRIGVDGQIEVLPADVSGFLRDFGADTCERALLIVALQGSDGTGPGDRLGIPRARVRQLLEAAGWDVRNLLDVVRKELPGADIEEKIGRAVTPYLGAGLFGQVEEDLLSILGDHARPPAVPRKRAAPSSVWHHNPALTYAGPAAHAGTTGGPSTTAAKMVRLLSSFYIG